LSFPQCDPPFLGVSGLDRLRFSRLFFSCTPKRPFFFFQFRNLGIWRPFFRVLTPHPSFLPLRTVDVSPHVRIASAISPFSWAIQIFLDSFFSILPPSLTQFGSRCLRVGLPSLFLRSLGGHISTLHPFLCVSAKQHPKHGVGPPVFKLYRFLTFLRSFTFSSVLRRAPGSGFSSPPPGSFSLGFLGPHSDSLTQPNAFFFLIPRGFQGFLPPEGEKPGPPRSSLFSTYVTPFF